MKGFFSFFFLVLTSALVSAQDISPSPSPQTPPGPMEDMPQMPPGHMGHHMQGFYGPYPMEREGSGTSWQPDSSPHEGFHTMAGPWRLMIHGFASLVYDRQGGPRGDEKVFSSNMAMIMAARRAGLGTLGLRVMLSLEPATIGRSGYPLLLQTGESADGRTPLIDRQHPHDLFMELAASYSVPFGKADSVFAYVGLPGEPALGPVTFMHRFSGMEFPDAPIVHHYLDSTHITYGVVTAGLVLGNLKFEASAFRGREPDEKRWDIESPRLDSYSGRLAFNPSRDWSFEVSSGHLKAPEGLEPGVNIERTTASATFNRSNWQSTFAFGRNDKSTGHHLNGFLLESTYRPGEAHTFLVRAQSVQKDELFASGPQMGMVFLVTGFSAGYIRDFVLTSHSRTGIGALLSLDVVPRAIEPAYGATPASFMIFLRTEVR
jgi:hypothetical protein